MLLGDRPLAEAMALHPAQFAQGQGLWQPLTAIFLDTAVGGGPLFVCLLAQWFCGSPLEGYWSTSRYVLMILVAALVGYAATGLLALVFEPIAAVPAMSGSLPMDMAAVVAFGVVFANTPYQPFGMSPVRGRVLAPFFAFLLLVVPLLSGVPWPALMPALIASLVALVFVTQPWRRSGKSGKVDKSKKTRSRGKNKSHLKLVHDADDLLN